MLLRGFDIVVILSDIVQFSYHSHLDVRIRARRRMYDRGSLRQGQKCRDETVIPQSGKGARAPSTGVSLHQSTSPPTSPPALAQRREPPGPRLSESAVLYIGCRSTIAQRQQEKNLIVRKERRKSEELRSDIVSRRASKACIDRRPIGEAPKSFLKVRKIHRLCTPVLLRF